MGGGLTQTCVYSYLYYLLHISRCALSTYMTPSFPSCASPFRYSDQEAKGRMIKQLHRVLRPFMLRRLKVHLLPSRCLPAFNEPPIRYRGKKENPGIESKPPPSLSPLPPSLPRPMSRLRCTRNAKPSCNSSLPLPPLHCRDLFSPLPLLVLLAVFFYGRVH